MTGRAGTAKGVSYIATALILIGEGFGEGRARGRPRHEAGGFFYWGLVGFFLFFFSSLVLASFLIGFFSDFGGFLETKMAPKIDFWCVFWDVFLEPSFLKNFSTFFHVFFKLETLKIVIFPREN